MATIVPNATAEEAPTWRLDRIIRLLDERRVSDRVAARIMEMLEEQPYVNETLGSQTEVAKYLKRWTDHDNSHG